MSRYVDADKLKNHYAWWGDTEQRKLFDDIVDEQPTADVQEVKLKNIKWVKREKISIEYQRIQRLNDSGNDFLYEKLSKHYIDTIPYCGECGKRLDDNFLNYCPNCGAKMDDSINEVVNGQ
jgi:NADH pyrophosphatase NudC (nudix superfamily)